MTILLILIAALVIFSISVDASWSNVLSAQRNNLVFEGRNMKYGAYSLRREQPRNMFIALMIVIGLTGAGSAAAMMMTKGDHESKRPSYKDVIIPIIPNIPPIDPIEKPAEKCKDSAPSAPPKGINNAVPVVTTDPNVKPLPSVDDLSNKKIGFTGDDDGDDFLKPVENKLGNGKGTGKQETKTDPKEVFPDKMPQFPGGEPALMTYMAERVDYGMLEVERGVSGTIYMSFIVLPDGSVTDIKTERGILYGENLEKKAREAIRKMPQWIPGIKDGQPVPVRFRIPLKFVLKSE